MDKLKQAIERYLAANTTRKSAGAKGAITKLVKERALSLGIAETRLEVLEVLKQFSELPNWVIQRFTPGSLYEEGDRIMGWWDIENQVQAEELPMSSHGGDRGCSVTFWRCPGEVELWRQGGFYQAEYLPVSYYSGAFNDSDSIKVDFPVERSPFFLEYGYALPCSLQWHWDDDGLVVTRSIISAGFWQAWKWHENSKWWFFQHRPELFADMEWWGTYPSSVTLRIQEIINWAD